MSNVDRAIQLLQQAVQLLSATTPEGAATTGQAVAPPTTFGGKSHELKFGKNKGKTLVDLYLAGELKYLGWVKDKFGIDRDTGQEDPKWAAQNAQVRAEAAALLNGTHPVCQPARPTYAAPAAPAEAPAQQNFEDDIPF